MQVVKQVLHMSDTKDVYKIGAWLEMKGLLKNDEEMRRKWWIYAIICLFIQGYPYFRVLIIGLR